MTEKLTIIIADDHPLISIALRLGVQRIAPQANIVEARSFATLCDAAHQHRDASLVLLDLVMPDVEGLSALQFLRNEFPALRVAIISGVEEPSWVRAADALGAVGFIPKATAPEKMQEILRDLISGGSWWPEIPKPPPPSRRRETTLEDRLGRLSKQELRIRLEIRDGRLNKQIAEALGIADSTVKVHITNLLRKLDLQNRTQAAVIAQRLLKGA